MRDIWIGGYKIRLSQTWQQHEAMIQQIKAFAAANETQQLEDYAQQQVEEAFVSAVGPDGKEITSAKDLDASLPHFVFEALVDPTKGVTNPFASGELTNAGSARGASGASESPPTPPESPSPPTPG